MVDFNDDSLVAVYNEELIRLSGEAAVPRHLENPDMTAKAVSPICGSEITVELKTEGERVTDFGFEVEACALTKSVVAVMRKAILGQTRADVARAGRELEAMLNGETVFPSGPWAQLAILAPVKDYKARHDSILLPFEAIEKAFKGREK